MYSIEHYTVNHKVDFFAELKKKLNQVMYVYIFPLAQMQYLIFKSTKDHSNLYKISKTKLGTFFHSIV